MTGMYNVLEKLRAGEPLSAKEQAIHEQGLVSVLREIHDELDAAGVSEPQRRQADGDCGGGGILTRSTTRGLSRRERRGWPRAFGCGDSRITRG
jgi:hypothetical protein